jgi:hypothetical protein
MASMKLKASAFRMGAGGGGLNPVNMSSGGMQHHGGAGGGAGGGGGQVMRLHGLSGQGEGDVPGRNRGGIGKRYGKPSVGFRGLGVDAPETILTTADPVGMYVRAIQSLIASLPEYHTTGTTPPSKTIESSGIWNFRTHMGLIDFLASVYGVEDISRFPAWGSDPGFMAFFVVEMFFGGFDLTAAFAEMRPFYEALGLPATSMREAIQTLSARENAERMRQVLDRVNRYIIGCEGGRAYGDPVVKYKGIGSAIADVVLPVALIALL